MKFFQDLLRLLFGPSNELAIRSDSEPINERKIAEETLAHAKEGYKNAQDVIRFVDTKTAVITGLSTLIAGSLIGILKWSIESDNDSHATLADIAVIHPCWIVCFYVLVALCFSATFVCITAAIWSVLARSRPRHLENKFTILFPCYKKRHETDACRVFERKLKGMTINEVLLEYEDQLRVVGLILSKKLKHIRVASFALLAELFLFFLAVILLAILYIDPDVVHANHTLAAILGIVSLLATNCAK
jgi:hypothetical protein